MNPDQIRTFLKAWEPNRERTIVIVDFGSVEKWKHGLGWKVGIRELATLVKNFAYGKRLCVASITGQTMAALSVPPC